MLTAYSYQYDLATVFKVWICMNVILLCSIQNVNVERSDFSYTVDVHHGCFTECQLYYIDRPRAMQFRN